MPNMRQHEQLKDVTITIASVAYNDERKPYATTIIFRMALEGSINDFIDWCTDAKGVVFVEVMKGEDFEPPRK